MMQRSKLKHSYKQVAGNISQPLNSKTPSKIGSRHKTFLKPPELRSNHQALIILAYSFTLLNLHKNINFLLGVSNIMGSRTEVNWIANISYQAMCRRISMCEV